MIINNMSIRSRFIGSQKRPPTFRALCAALLSLAVLTSCNKKKGTQEATDHLSKEPHSTSTVIQAQPERDGANGSAPFVAVSKSTGTNTADGTASPNMSQGPGAETKTTEPPQPSCFTLTYEHRHPGRSDEECENHRNLIQVKHQGINPSSVCIRVNGTPVRHKVVQSKKGKTTLGFLVDPVPGMDAKITAQYCINGMTCREDCTVPKDEFMDAIGGEDSELLAGGKIIKIAKWDPTDRSADEDIAAELDAELRKQLGGESDLAVFDRWSSNDGRPSCGGGVADSKLTAPGKTQRKVAQKRAQ